MGFAFRLMIFVLMFNLATGVTIFMFGQSAWLLSGLSDGGNGQNLGVNQANQLNGTFSAGGGVPVEETSFWYRFLDIISLGFYNKIKDFAYSSIFAIPMLCVKLQLIPYGLLYIFNSAITFIFVFGTFELFTGKDLVLR